MNRGSSNPRTLEVILETPGSNSAPRQNIMNQKTLAILLFAPLIAIVTIGTWLYFDGNIASVEAVMAGFLAVVAVELIVLYFLIRNDEEFQPVDKQPKPIKRKEEIIDVDWSVVSGRELTVSDQNRELWSMK